MIRKAAAGAVAWRSFIAVLALVGALPAWVGPVLACTGPPVPFDRVADGATRIVVATVESRFALPGQVPNYTFAIDAVIRDTDLPAVAVGDVLAMDAPAVHACGDYLDVPVGVRIVLALDVPAFAAAPPLAAAWGVADDGSVADIGLVDGPAGWESLDAFRVAIGEPPATEPPAEAPVEDGAPIAPIVLGAALAIGILGGRLMIRGRRAIDQ